MWCQLLLLIYSRIGCKLKWKLWLLKAALIRFPYLRSDYYINNCFMLIYNLLIFWTSLECPSQSNARAWRPAEPFLTNRDTLIKLGAYLCSNITGIKCCCPALKIIMKFRKQLNPHAPNRFTPHAPVLQKIADQRWLIANTEKNRHFFLYKMMWFKVG